MPVNNEEGEGSLVESNSSASKTTTKSEFPRKSYRVTVELPIFLTVMGMSLIGVYIS